LWAHANLCTLVIHRHGLCPWFEHSEIRRQ
jgi:hypothetical protein